MNWLPKKKRIRDMQLREVQEKVEALEGRVDRVTEVLIELVDDPWSLNVLKSIHEK